MLFPSGQRPQLLRIPGSFPERPLLCRRFSLLPYYQTQTQASGEKTDPPS